MRRFLKINRDLRLTDFPLMRGPFTRSDGPNNKFMSRHECFLVNEGWDYHFSGSM